jgi:hypothetical protein
MTERFDILNRFTGKVQSTVEIECAPDAPHSVKLGLAVMVAIKAMADLSRAYLSGANLSGADFSGANLSGAYLSRANLSGANLAGANLLWADLFRANLSRADISGANLAGANLEDANLAGVKGLTDESLRQIKADMWMTLARARHEVPALIAALESGRVEGSQYEGECACLVGTLANAVGADYRATFPDASVNHPAERWFAMIHKGDKPGDDSAGGFAATWALKWAKEFDALVNGERLA